MAVVVVAGMAAGGPARGQAEEPGADPEQRPLAAPLLDWSHAQHAHRMIEGWLKEGQIDDQAGPQIPVSGLFAVRVTVRTAGHTIGAGEARRPDGKSDPIDGPVDLTGLVRTAATEVLDEIRHSLADAKLRAVVAGRFDKNAPPPLIEQIAGRLLVDVQLAHQLQDIQIPPDAEASAVYGTFAPGFHGLRVLAPDGTEPSVMWPATALAMNVSPQSQLTRLLSRHGRRHDQVENFERLDQIGKLGRHGGLRLQRFEVIHVVRPLPEQTPLQLVRGQEPKPPIAINSAELDRIGDRLAAHLRGRFTTEREVLGTYQPTQDQFDPRLATDQEAALACYALIRHVRHALAMARSDDVLWDMAGVASETTAHLARRILTGETEQEPAAAALGLLAMIELGLIEESQKQSDPEDLIQLKLRFQRPDPLTRDQFGRILSAWMHDEGPLRIDRQLKQGMQATDSLVTAALAALYDQTRKADIGSAVATALDSLWDGAGGSPNVNALPWYVMAHSRAAHLLADEELDRLKPQDRRRAIGSLVAKLCEQQVIEPPLLGPHDVIGGFELFRAPAGSPPNPDWRTAQLLAFLAISLRDEDITADHNRLGWLTTAGLAGRFIDRLMFDSAGCFYARSVADTRGGVRLTLWDNTLAITPTAMSLLAVTELQESLEALRPAAPTAAHPGDEDVGP